MNITNNLLNLLFFLIADVMRREGSIVVAVVWQVKGGAVTVGGEKHWHLQVL